MKKVIIIIMMIFIVTGCSLFNKKPNDTNTTQNNTTVIDNNEPKIKILPDFNETDMQNDIKIDGNKIDPTNESNDSKRANLTQYLYFLGGEVYNQKIYTNYAQKDGKYKISIKELQDDNYDVSLIEEACSGCDLSQTYIIIDATDENNPVNVDIYYKDEKTDDNSVDVLYELAKKIYDKKEYTSFTKNGEVYTVTLREIKTVLGYDISNINCSFETKVEFHLDHAQYVDYPIETGECILEVN